MTAAQGGGALPEFMADIVAKVQAAGIEITTGDVSTALGRVETRRAVDAEQRAGRVARWQATLPPAFTTARPLHPDIAAWVGRLVSGTAGALVIAGPVGVGKTEQALTAVEAAYAAGWAGTALRVKPRQWRDAIGPPEDRQALAGMAAAGVLILDDLGAHRIGAYPLEHLYDLADERWEHQRPTILPTNVLELTDLFRERVASRFARSVTVVELDGPDHRREVTA